MLTKGALDCWALKSVSRETNRVKQGQGLRSQRPGPFFRAPGWVGAHLRARARGPWATDQAARPPGHGSRTRARGPGVCEPGHRITNTDRPGTQTQTRTRQQLRDQAATGSSCATRSAGSHRHQVQAARPRQRITAAAALTWQQITAAAAVTDQRITANQAARPTAQAATGSSCATQTRQQLRTIRAARFGRPVARATRQAQAATRASG